MPSIKGKKGAKKFLVFAKKLKIFSLLGIFTPIFIFAKIICKKMF